MRAAGHKGAVATGQAEPRARAVYRRGARRSGSSRNGVVRWSASDSERASWHVQSGAASRRVARSRPRSAKPISERAKRASVHVISQRLDAPMRGHVLFFFHPLPSPYTPETQVGWGMGPIFRVTCLLLAPRQKNSPRHPPPSSKVIFLAYKLNPQKIQKNLKKWPLHSVAER